MLCFDVIKPDEKLERAPQTADETRKILFRNGFQLEEDVRFVDFS